MTHKIITFIYYNCITVDLIGHRLFKTAKSKDKTISLEMANQSHNDLENSASIIIKNRFKRIIRISDSTIPFIIYLKKSLRSKM